MSRDGDVNSGTKRGVGGQDLCERENDTNRKDMADTGRHAGARARRRTPPPDHAQFSLKHAGVKGNMSTLEDENTGERLYDVCAGQTVE